MAICSGIEFTLSVKSITSLISLFDVVSMLKGETAWIYKLIILLVVGIVGYVAGSIKFKKKDLPL